jgi:cytidine deaminase
MADQDLPPEQARALLDAARAMLTRAYAPYSGFRVGAAVLTENGRIHAGCNAENASYGLSICAERAAVFAAVAAEGPNLRIRAVAVVNADDAPCAPCGACRQVIAEFGPEALVLYRGSDGLKAGRVDALLPDSFRL